MCRHSFVFTPIDYVMYRKRQSSRVETYRRSIVNYENGKYQVKNAPQRLIRSNMWRSVLSWEGSTIECVCCGNGVHECKRHFKHELMNINHGQKICEKNVHIWRRPSLKNKPETNSNNLSLPSLYIAAHTIDQFCWWNILPQHISMQLFPFVYYRGCPKNAFCFDRQISPKQNCKEFLKRINFKNLP